MNSNGRTVVVIGPGVPGPIVEPRADFAPCAPAKRVDVPAEPANAVLFALTNCFLTGSVLPSDGGALLMQSD